MSKEKKPLRGSVQAFREAVWGPDGPVDELDFAMTGLSGEGKLKAWESVMSSKSDKKLDFGKIVCFGTGGETQNNLCEIFYKGETLNFDKNEHDEEKRFFTPTRDNRGGNSSS